MSTETQSSENVVNLKSEATPAEKTAQKARISTRKNAARKAAPTKKAASKTGARRVKESAKKTGTKRVAGKKLQTQAPKAWDAFIKAKAKSESTKEQVVRPADIIRKAVGIGLKKMGFSEAEG